MYTSFGFLWCTGAHLSITHYVAGCGVYVAQWFHMLLLAYKLKLNNEDVTATNEAKRRVCQLKTAIMTKHCILIVYIPCERDFVASALGK